MNKLIYLLLALPRKRQNSCEEVIAKLELQNFEPDKFRLTISLSEPFQPSAEKPELCYKLVASVINVTDITKRLGWI